MLTFDEKTRVMEAGTLPEEFKMPVPNLYDNARNKDFVRWYKEDLPTLITTEFKAMLDMLADTTRNKERKVGLTMNDVKVELSGTQRTLSYKKSALASNGEQQYDSVPHLAVYVKWGGSDVWCNILDLPAMDIFGTLYHGSPVKEYKFIHMLEQSEGITYESKQKIKEVKLKIGSDIIRLSLNKSSVRFEYTGRIKKGTNRTKFDAFTLLYALAQKAIDEGTGIIEPVQYRDMFSSPMLKNKCLKHTNEQLITYISSSARGVSGSDVSNLSKEITGTDEYHIDGKWDATNLKVDLINLNDFSYAIGKKLSDDVYSGLEENKNSIIAYRGTIVNELLTKKFIREAVPVIYIESEVNIIGNILEESVTLSSLKRGTINTDEIRDALESRNINEKFMYISEDYDLSNDPIAIPPKTEITKDLLSVFMINNISEVIIKKGTKSEVVAFKEEVAGSLHKVKMVRANKVYTLKDYVYYNGHEWIEPSPYLTAHDLFGLISAIAKSANGANLIAHSDFGFRKKVVTIREAFTSAFIKCCRISRGDNRYSKLKSYLQTKGSHEEIRDPDLVGEFKRRAYAFTCAFMDRLVKERGCLELIKGEDLTNPVTYVSAMSKANVHVKNSKSVADDQRKIAIGSYGRIDPYEIPQSKKMGVVNNFAIGSTYDENGVFKTSYFKVTKQGDELIVSRNASALTVIEEERFIIADAMALEFKKYGDNLIITSNPNKLIIARVPSPNSIDRHSFGWVRVKDIQYINSFASQHISWTTGTIPNMGANESARIVFEDSQVKQAKGLVFGDKPLQLTPSYEVIPKLAEHYAGYAPKAWVYQNTVGSAENLSTRDYQEGKYYYFLEDRRSMMEEIPEGERNKKDIIGDSILFEPEAVKLSDYSVTVLHPYISSNNNKSLSELRKHSQAEWRVDEGDTLYESNMVNDGILTIGANALVGYIPTGFNYEDGTHMSEDFANKLVSYGIHHMRIPIKRAHNRRRPRLHTQKGLAKYYDWTNKHDYVEIKYYGLETTFREYLTKGVEGFLYGMNVIEKQDDEGKTFYPEVDIIFISVDPFKHGDKISNRHGNKGVGINIVPTSNMPRLINGMALDLASNPSGVPSRMNFGQILEAKNSIPMLLLDFYLMADAIDSITTDERDELVKFVVDLSNSISDEDVANIASKYSGGVIPNNFIKWAISRVGKAREFAGCFDYDGNAILVLPDKNNTLTETKCTVGICTQYKLVQEVDHKIASRGGLAKDGITYGAVDSAPNQGGSRGGGQKMGNMEMHALLAYGVSNYIYDITHFQGDNPMERVDKTLDVALSDKYRNELVSFDKYKSQRRSVTNFVSMMLGLGIVLDDTDEDAFVHLDKDYGKSLEYPNFNRVLKDASDLKQRNKVKYNERKAIDTGSIEVVKGSTFEDFKSNLLLKLKSKGGE